jgi:hypothetical protein
MGPAKGLLHLVGLYGAVVGKGKFGMIDTIAMAVAARAIGYRAVADMIERDCLSPEGVARLFKLSAHHDRGRAGRHRPRCCRRAVQSRSAEVRRSRGAARLSSLIKPMGIWCVPNPTASIWWRV